MSYLKKNVNFFLLLLIVVVLLSTVGLTTYYQTTYKNLSISYNTKISELDALSSNLSKQRFELNRTYSELRLRTEDKSKLDDLYSQLTQDNDDLQSKLTSTKSNLAATEAELINTKKDLVEANSDLSEALLRIQRLESDVDGLRDEINEQEEIIECLEANSGDPNAC